MKYLPKTIRVVLGVTASIACEKACGLARYLIKRRCDVHVVLTPSATKFVAPLTFQELTRNPVTIDLWSEREARVIDDIECRYRLPCIRSCVDTTKAILPERQTYA